MLPTYPAILRDGRLEWDEGGPPPLPPTAIRVHVTLLDFPAPAPRGPAMAAALKVLADGGGPSGWSGDPVEWQRSARSDRPQPGRSEACSTATS